MASEDYQSGNIRATLALSPEEARTGTVRTLTLTGGKQVTVTIPPGVQTGQEIRFEGQGTTTYTGRAGALIITAMVAPAENFGSQPFYPNNPSQTGTYITPTPPPPPPPPPSNVSSPSYPGNPPITNYRGFPSTTGNPPSTPQAVSASGQFSSPNPYTSYERPSQPGPLAPAQPPIYMPPVPPSTPKRRSTIWIALVVLLVLVLLGGSGLVLYATVYQPYKINADNTATAVAHVTATAQIVNAQATSDAATKQAIANATATTQAKQKQDYTTATAGNPALNDSLQAPDTNNWDTGNECAFTNGAYHVTSAKANYIILCFAENSNFDNFAFQVHMKIIKGDAGGLLFRADSAKLKNYIFTISQDGSYKFSYYPDGSGTTATDLDQGSSNLIKTGLNQENVVTVVARKNVMELYVNQQYLTTITDANLTSGQIGLAADNSTATSTEVAYTQAQVWKL